MIKPKQLKQGDTIAVLAPSSALSFIFPHIFKNGIRVLQEVFGFNIIEFPTVKMSPQELSANPKLRAEEINQAFADKKIQGIITAIGGEDSIRILEYLDIDLIKSNPKFFMGFSDSTNFLSYLNRMGLVTYYGSSIMAGFSQIENFPETIAEYKAVLFGSETYELKPFTHWAASYKDWSKPEAVGQVAQVRTDDVGYRWLNKGTATQGRLWGGCIESLAGMLGTKYFPPSDFFDGKILFLETSADRPDITFFRGVLRNLAVQGILQRLNGLLIGKPKYETEDKHNLDKAISSIMTGEFGLKDLTVVTNLEFGHADPKHILPMGINLALNPQEEKLQFTESLFGN